jgi:two-component system cell cycle response regulator CpdR
MAKILIAEDDDAIRGLIVRALKDDGHDLIATADGAAALHALSQHNGEFKLLLTDVKMPVMDGVALAMAAGRDYPEMPIMLMTGYADQRERAHELDALVHDVIAKPFSVDQIKGAVREALVERH